MLQTPNLKTRWSKQEPQPLDKSFLVNHSCRQHLVILVNGSPKLLVAMICLELLRHADEFFHPSCDHGGPYYQRNDDIVDHNGNWVYVDPYTGNAGIGYARLNVQAGQKKMFDHPWTQDYVNSTPWVDGFGLDEDVDCLRGLTTSMSKLSS
jgi:hypothetical protein